MTKELCKFFLNNSCTRGNDCIWSHNTKEFPCKYLHGTGLCDKAQACNFNHDFLTEPEIQKFMKENEEFLRKVLKETGKTNLSDYFLNYLHMKEA